MFAQQNHFSVIVNGQIEHAEFPGAANLACTFQFVYGPDWEVVRLTGENASLESGMTQIAERGRGYKANYVWNFPIEIVFRSTNPWGWPKIVFTVCEVQGKDKLPVRGYGWTHVPVSPGQYASTVRLFAPRNSSWIQSILSMFQGKTPEFVNPSFACEGEGREATRVQNEGAIRVRWDIMVKDMMQFGFEPKRTSVAAKDQHSMDNDLASLLDSSTMLQKFSLKH